MDWRFALQFLPPKAAVIGTLALCGAAAIGHAQSADETLPAELATDVSIKSGPVFVPSEEAAFEEAFAPYDTPADPLERHDAVDITEIEPAEPEAQSLGSGVASYYGKRFHGRRTANGERFDMNGLTAAHKTLPFGSKVRVTNRRNGRSVIVRINDRGPFVRGRTIDLSRRAAEQIGMISSGHAGVELELVTS